MERVLVSACMIGRPCRFDGRDKRIEPLVEALNREGVEVVAFCPEEAGGLGTPRPAARLDGGDGHAVADGTARVLTAEGKDVTEVFLVGARLAVARAQETGCRVAYLKERSPSCGCGEVHTTAGVVRGTGVTCALLQRAGIATISVDG